MEIHLQGDRRSARAMQRRSDAGRPLACHLSGMPQRVQSPSSPAAKSQLFLPALRSSRWQTFVSHEVAEEKRDGHRAATRVGGTVFPERSEPVPFFKTPPLVLDFAPDFATMHGVA
jgi:hypothetical protein